ncbi:MAG: hypothetical protein Q9163_002581 [Psora crenata]
MARLIIIAFLSILILSCEATSTTAAGPNPSRTAAVAATRTELVCLPPKPTASLSFSDCRIAVSEFSRRYPDGLYILTHDTRPRPRTIHCPLVIAIGSCELRIDFQNFETAELWFVLASWVNELGMRIARLCIGQESTGGGGQLTAWREWVGVRMRISLTYTAQAASTGVNDTLNEVASINVTQPMVNTT